MTKIPECSQLGVKFAAILKDELGDQVNMWDVIDEAEVDSLEYINFIKRLETEFSVRLEDEALANAKTFFDLECLATGCEPATPC
jgi:acyl carrier protein